MHVCLQKVMGLYLSVSCHSLDVSLLTSRHVSLTAHSAPLLETLVSFSNLAHLKQNSLSPASHPSFLPASLGSNCGGNFPTRTQGACQTPGFSLAFLALPPQTIVSCRHPFPGSSQACPFCRLPCHAPESGFQVLTAFLTGITATAPNSSLCPSCPQPTLRSKLTSHFTAWLKTFRATCCPQNIVQVS